MAKLDDIHAKLLEASRLLDMAAREVRELDGKGGKSSAMRGEPVAKIGSAIAEVMLVRHQIYLLRPDLMPGYLQDGNRNSGGQDSEEKDN